MSSAPLENYDNQRMGWMGNKMKANDLNFARNRLNIGYLTVYQIYVVSSIFCLLSFVVVVVVVVADVSMRCNAIVADEPTSMILHFS